jgi:acetyl esterase/lipase
MATPEEVRLTAVYLWDGPAPGARGDAEEDRPRINVLLADPKMACGTGVIVCPGGGYNVRAMDYEGLQVAQWLNSLGNSAFLLPYRIRNAGYTPEDAFADGVRAVRFVRHHAAEYGVDPRRIGMIGFSAGGHLIARVAVEHDAGDPQAADPVERAPSRPDFVLLIYTPSRGWLQTLQERPSAADLPPAFIFHTTNDQLVPVESALEILRGWKASGAEAELHVFGGYGPHGVGLASGLPGAQDWPSLAAVWMRRSGLLTGKERVAVEGRVTVDGAPSGSAWVTFVPLDSDHDPIAAVTAGLEDGAFSLDAAHGPVTGRHRIEVRVYCKQFLTVPSQADLRTYTSASPGGEPLQADLRPGRNRVDIAIASA